VVPVLVMLVGCGGSGGRPERDARVEAADAQPEAASDAASRSDAGPAADAAGALDAAVVDAGTPPDAARGAP
jgi:hypothetical protein